MRNHMKISKLTSEVLNNFSKINTNLVVKKGSTISTVSPEMYIMATYTGEEKFDEDVAIYNLPEFLNIIAAFDNPDLELGTKSMTIKSGKQKVNFGYAEEHLLIKPPTKSKAFPDADITFTLQEAVLTKLKKMSEVLSLDDLAIIGDGNKITLKVFDKSNPSSNDFVVDTDIVTSDVFQINFKVEKIKIIPGNYTVEISKKPISKFTNDSIALFYYIAVESDSEFS